MSYCSKCGAYIPDGDDVCPACDTRTAQAAPQASSAARAQEPPKTEYKEYKDSGEYHSGTYSSGSGEYHSGAYSSGYGDTGANGSMYSNEYDADAAENRGLGYLCYLGILFLIPYFLKPDSQFIRYHCNQGLVLFLFCILVSVCWNIPVLGWIAGLAGSFFAFSCLIKGLSNVSKGKRSPLPLIGDITLLK